MRGGGKGTEGEKEEKEHWKRSRADGKLQEEEGNEQEEEEKDQ